MRIEAFLPRVLFLLVPAALAACGEEVMTPSVTPPPVRPEHTTTATLEVSTLAATLGPALFAASYESESWVASADGLFRADALALTEVSETPVLGLAAVEGAGTAIATETGIEIRRGDETWPAFGDTFQSLRITALAPQGSNLWIGTSEALFRYRNDELLEFTELTDVRRIDAHAGSTRVVATDGDGTRWLMREDGDAWSLERLDDEIAADEILVAATDRVFARQNGQLLERVTVGADQVAWRPVAMSVDEAPVGDTSDLDVDPVSGGLWVLTPERLYHYDGTTAERIALPGTPAVIHEIEVSNVHEVWLRGDDALSRGRTFDRTVTWAEDIAPFSAANCERCHQELGTAHPLTTIDVWRAEIDKIITQLEAETMPLDGEPLVGGSVELVREWRDDGLLP